MPNDDLRAIGRRTLPPLKPSVSNDPDLAALITEAGNGIWHHEAADLADEILASDWYVALIERAEKAEGQVAAVHALAGEWFRGCGPSPRWQNQLRAALAAAAPILTRDAARRAWLEGHAAGVDYQGDGWNSDAHDPDRDNPYRAGGDQ